MIGLSVILSMISFVMVLSRFAEPNKNELMNYLVGIFTIITIICMFLIPTPLDKYNLYDYLKAKRLQYYYEHYHK